LLYIKILHFNVLARIRVTLSNVKATPVSTHVKDNFANILYLTNYIIVKGLAEM